VKTLVPLVFKVLIFKHEARPADAGRTGIIKDITKGTKDQKDTFLVFNISSRQYGMEQQAILPD
jgi:hypothetical protein